MAFDAGTEVTDETQAFHQSAMVCDFTLPYADIGDPRKKEETLPRYFSSGVNCVSITLGGDTGSVADTMKLIAKERDFLLRRPDHYVLVSQVEDIRRAKSENKLAVIIHFQGSAPVDGELAMVGVYYELGVRHMVLAYNARNKVGDGCFEPNDAGLSVFGKKFVQEMNRVGMLIDCSHTGYRTSMQAMDLSDSPVIFSHANPASVHKHVRNIKDDQIKACADTGGVVGILGISNMLGPENDASAALLVRHIDYCVQLVGIDHVGISLDFVYDPEATFLWAIAQAGGELPESGNYSAAMSFVQPEQYPDITQQLLNLGYSNEDVCKVLGENWLSVASKVWK